MGIAVFPAASAGGIKSVQRGSAGGAGTVTITAVDITKAFVNVFGTTSSGNVSASFGLNSTNFTSLGMAAYVGNNFYRPPGTNSTAGTDSGANATNVSGFSVNTGINAAGVNAGSNNLVSAVVQGYLSGSTSLVVSGACRWEVVEFN